MFRDYEKHPYGTFEGNYQQQQIQRKSYYAMVQGKIYDLDNLNARISDVFTPSKK